MSALRTVEDGIAEGEHAAVGSHQPVPGAIGCGSHADNRLIEVCPPVRTVEDSIAEGEDAPVGSHQPVALAIGRGCNADDRLIEGMPPFEP